MKIKNIICPVERAGILDLGFRKLFQNPKKILKPYITNGMTVLDVGCGPGFFSIEIAKMVGDTGKVIASDLQDGMLQKLKAKINNTSLNDIIYLHKCQNNTIGLKEKVDFILVFYMLHEVPDQFGFLSEIKILLNPKGKVLIVEPGFHISKKDFENSIELSKKIGFKKIEDPKVFMSRTAVLKINE